MLKESYQNTPFDQFLFLHFDLKKEAEAVLETVVLSKKTVKASKPIVSQEPLVKKEVVKKAVKKKIKENIALSEPVVAPKPITDSCQKPKIVSSLTSAIDSIPDRVRAIDIEALAHKHESEWHHAFRDIKEDLIKEISKKHPNHHGTFKLKGEIKDFWEQLDEPIEKMILELERIFQAFPNMARVAVIYLLSIVIAIPLMFMSGTKTIEQRTSYVAQSEPIASIEPALQITKQMKSDFVAKHSQEIIERGLDTFAVTRPKDMGRVAGVYEMNQAENAPEGQVVKQKINSIYNYLKNLKNDLGSLLP